MNEKQIVKEVSIVLDDVDASLLPIADNDNVVEIVEEKKGKPTKKGEGDKIALARALYISTDMSIPAVARQIGVSEETLYKHSAKGKWSLLKVNPEFQEWSLQLVNEIYESIDFYEKAKDSIGQMLGMAEYFNPKDVKVIVEAYRLAEDRTTSLRLIKENGNKENGTDL